VGVKARGDEDDGFTLAGDIALEPLKLMYGVLIRMLVNKPLSFLLSEILGLLLQLLLEQGVLHDLTGVQDQLVRRWNPVRNT